MHDQRQVENEDIILKTLREYLNALTSLKVEPFPKQEDGFTFNGRFVRGRISSSEAEIQRDQEINNKYPKMWLDIYQSIRNEIQKRCDILDATRKQAICNKKKGGSASLVLGQIEINPGFLYELREVIKNMSIMHKEIINRPKINAYIKCILETVERVCTVMQDDREMSRNFCTLLTELSKQQSLCARFNLPDFVPALDAPPYPESDSELELRNLKQECQAYQDFLAQHYRRVTLERLALEKQRHTQEQERQKALNSIVSEYENLQHIEEERLKAEEETRKQDQERKEEACQRRQIRLEKKEQEKQEASIKELQASQKKLETQMALRNLAEKHLADMQLFDAQMAEVLKALPQIAERRQMIGDAIRQICNLLGYQAAFKTNNGSHAQLVLSKEERPDIHITVPYHNGTDYHLNCIYRSIVSQIIKEKETVYLESQRQCKNA